MRKLGQVVCLLFAVMFFAVSPVGGGSFASADSSKKYFTVYDENNKVLFLKGDDINEGDNYLSSDNKLYEIYSVDNSAKTAKAKFISDEKLPEYKVKPAKNKNKKVKKSKQEKAVSPENN